MGTVFVVPDAGFGYRPPMRCELRRDYSFEAARQLTGIDPGHPCARIHGHSFRLRIKLAGEVHESTGWVMDFADIDAVVAPVVDELDHSLLNEHDGLANPTSELLAHWVWERIATALPGLVSIRISETDASSVTYRGE